MTGTSRGGYRDLFERTRVGLVRTRVSDGKVLLANRAAARMFGFDSPSEVVGTLETIVLYRRPEERERLVRDLERCGEVVGREVELVRRDGTRMWARISARVMPDDGWLEASVEDITELHRSRVAEQVMLRIGTTPSEAPGLGALIARIAELLESALDTSNFYVALYDPGSGRYSFPFYRDAHDTLSEYEGLPLDGSLTDWVRRTGRPALVTPERHRRLSESGEVELVGTDSAQWLGVPLRTDGDAFGVMAVQSYDDPRRYDDHDLELLAYAAGPVARAVEKTRAEADRRQMERRLQELQRLESLAVLAGGVAHDFNNLLQSILGSCDLARLRPDDRSGLDEQLDRIRGAAESAAELVRQMLAFSGGGAAPAEEVDLVELVRGMEAALRRTVPARIPIELRLVGGPLPVIADPADLRQVVASLVDNAAEAVSGSSPVVVELGEAVLDRTTLRRLTVGDAARPGRYAALEVRDRGCGMEASTLERVFDPFFSTKFTGRGMGMAAVRGVVRRAGGAVDIDSAPGEGTRVWVYLPLTSTDRRAEGDSPEARSGAGVRPLRVLVADDDDGVRATVEGMLEAAGLEVVAVEDGRSAVEAFRADPDGFDVVLLDLVMPRMGGRQAHDGIREIRPGQPVVLSSGYAEGTGSDLGGGPAPAAFLQKPYRAQRLLEVIRAVSGRR